MYVEVWRNPNKTPEGQIDLHSESDVSGYLCLIRTRFIPQEPVLCHPWLNEGLMPNAGAFAWKHDTPSELRVPEPDALEPMSKPRENYEVIIHFHQPRFPNPDETPLAPQRPLASILRYHPTKKRIFSLSPQEAKGARRRIEEMFPPDPKERIPGPFYTPSSAWREGPEKLPPERSWSTMGGGDPQRAEKGHREDLRGVSEEKKGIGAPLNPRKLDHGMSLPLGCVHRRKGLMKR